MPSVEQLFIPATSVGSTDNQPTITQSLQYVRGQVEADITEFTTWKTQLLSLGQQRTGECTEPVHVPMASARALPSSFTSRPLSCVTDLQSACSADFSSQLEMNINTVLCAVQTLVKRQEREEQEKQHEGVKRGEDVTVASSLTCMLLHICLDIYVS